MKWLNAFIAWSLVGLVYHGYMSLGAALGISAFYLILLTGVWLYFEYIIPKKED